MNEPNNEHKLKSAEEWRQIWLDDREIIDDKTFEERLTQRIHDIQLNAYKAGMTEAAEIAWSHKVAQRFESDYSWNMACQQINKEVINACDKKGEL